MLRVAPKASIAEYSWDELKEISRAIAAAGCPTEGLAIARIYRLVNDELKFRGDTKEVVLEDGTTAQVRILGFCHDDLADGPRKAGISFEFADVPLTRRMNAEMTNEGGWYASEMRDWLNSVFWGMLPQDLRSNIVEVKKRTHYRDELGPDVDALHMAETFDKLWLLSIVEVYGRMSTHKSNVPWRPDVLGVEGTQYQLYTDNDVSVDNYGFCKKRGADSWWWLRSPRAYDSYWFRGVNSDGGWANWYNAYGEGGVSPGFCF